MSILDPVRNKLAPDVWSPKKELYPHIKRQILKKLYTFLKPENVVSIYVVGTIAGYQYSDSSDIDVNIEVNPPELVDSPQLKAKRKAADGDLVPGTKHEINYFLIPWNREKPEFWGDAPFGVWNLKTDSWANPPGNPEDIRDPQEEFFIELQSASLYLNQFRRLLEQYRAKVKQLNTLPKGSNIHEALKESIKDDISELVDFAHDLDRMRKFAYDKSFGIPRKSWENVVFKLMHHSDLEKEFEFFKELKTKDSTNWWGPYY